MGFVDWLRVLVLGIIEGVTEWLPISSTGHLILLDSIWQGNSTVFTEDFNIVFNVVIQFGAILAVVTLFFHKLNPLSNYKTAQQKKNTWKLWGKVMVAVIPAVIAGLLLDDWMDEHLYNGIVVASMLILYGIAFIVVERIYRDRDAKIVRFSQLSYKTAFFIGLFQCLALVPGTSRSGVTIMGGMILGLSRYLATEFTFYMAIPVMLGASVLKMFKYFFIKQMTFTGTQWAVLLVGSVIAYLVSLFVIKFLLQYVKRHTFVAFGIYRIVLGVIVLIVSLLVLL